MMISRSAILMVSLGLSVAPAVAGPSTQHSGQAVQHSGQASAHGSSALVSGGATVAAVPIIAFGSAMAISGAALEEVGTGAVTAGSSLLRADEVRHAPAVGPNGPPVLD